MGTWELSRSIFVTGSTHGVSDVAHHPAMHGAASSSNNGVVVVMSVVLFGVLLLLAAQINPLRRGSDAFRRRRTTSDQ